MENQTAAERRDHSGPERDRTADRVRQAGPSGPLARPGGVTTETNGDWQKLWPAAVSPGKQTLPPGPAGHIPAINQRLERAGCWPHLIGPLGLVSLNVPTSKPGFGEPRYVWSNEA